MKRKPSVRLKWTAWERAEYLTAPGGVRVEIPDFVMVVSNNAYQVQMRMMPEPVPPFGKVLWLSIKRRDKRSVHDWRDLQRIKNELVGPEYEAVEIYPAETRLVDTANQYHLWVFWDGYQLPFGYEDRRVADERVEANGARQRPFLAGERPADCLTPEELLALPEERLRVPVLDDPIVPAKEIRT